MHIRMPFDVLTTFFLKQAPVRTMAFHLARREVVGSSSTLAATRRWRFTTRSQHPPESRQTGKEPRVAQSLPCPNVSHLGHSRPSPLLRRGKSSHQRIKEAPVREGPTMSNSGMQKDREIVEKNRKCFRWYMLPLQGRERGRRCPAQGGGIVVLSRIVGRGILQLVLVDFLLPPLTFLFFTNPSKALVL